MWTWIQRGFSLIYFFAYSQAPGGPSKETVSTVLSGRVRLHGPLCVPGLHQACFWAPHLLFEIFCIRDAAQQEWPRHLAIASNQQPSSVATATFEPTASPKLCLCCSDVITERYVITEPFVITGHGVNGPAFDVCCCLVPHHPGSHYSLVQRERWGSRLHLSTHTLISFAFTFWMLLFKATSKEYICWRRDNTSLVHKDKNRAGLKHS